MIVGVDLDEILASFVEGFIKYYNKTFCANYEYNDFYLYNFWEILDVTRSEAINLVYEFHNTDYFNEIKPVEGSIEAVSELSRRHDLYIITSRQEDVIEETKEWVEKYYPGKFKDVLFSYDLSKRNHKPVSKSTLCRQINAGVIIEDSIKYASECARQGIKVILLNKPWNQGLNLEGIIRVNDWEEIKKCFP